MRLAAPFFAVAVVALTLTGCGSATQAATTAPTVTVTSVPTETPTATPTPTPTTFAVSHAATCALLAGTKQDGPLYQYINTITTVKATDTAGMDKLRALKDQLQGIADHAQPSMRQLIENMWSQNLSDFKAAGTELVTECH